MGVTTTNQDEILRICIDSKQVAQDTGNLYATGFKRYSLSIIDELEITVSMYGSTAEHSCDKSTIYLSIHTDQ
jgi:hypothetical protein